MKPGLIALLITTFITTTVPAVAVAGSYCVPLKPEFWDQTCVSESTAALPRWQSFAEDIGNELAKLAGTRPVRPPLNATAAAESDPSTGPLGARVSDHTMSEDRLSRSPMKRSAADHGLEG